MVQGREPAGWSDRARVARACLKKTGVADGDDVLGHVVGDSDIAAHVVREVELAVKEQSQSLNLRYYQGQQLILSLLIIALGALAYVARQDGEELIQQYALGGGGLLILLWLRVAWKMRRSLKL